MMVMLWIRNIWVAYRYFAIICAVTAYDSASYDVYNAKSRLHTDQTIIILKYYFTIIK